MGAVLRMLSAMAFVTALPTAAAEVTFTAKPRVAKSGDKTLITFTISAPADVEVAIVDAQEKVVRSLAAGVLFDNTLKSADASTNAVKMSPPPPPLKPGLAQSIEWDGKDDWGVPCLQPPSTRHTPPFRVRVRAGMSARFGRTIGGSPYTGVLGDDGLAIAPDGTLYIKMGSFVPQLHEVMPWHLRRFDRQGKYQATLLPYPPSTDPARTPGFKLAETGGEGLTPTITNPLDPALFRFGDGIHGKVVDGHVIFVDSRNALMTFFKVDGSNAIKTVPMRTAPDKLKWPQWLTPQLAFSPDGRYAYYSNVANTPYDGKKPADIDPNFPQGRIYRQDLSTPGANPEVFFDLVMPDWGVTNYWMPSAWDKKTAAAGIDVDGKGHIFVGDLVNHEVVEISPDGKRIAAAKIAWPDKVLVGRKSDAIYVVSCAVSRGFRPASTLIKITGRGAEAREVARLPLVNGLGKSLVLDESGDLPALWLGSDHDVVRVEDRGSELAVVGGSIANSDTNAIGFVCFGDVDTDAELVYITSGMGPVWRYHGLTGEGGKMPFKACDVAIGTDGMIYGWGDTGSYQGPIARYARDGKPAPLASTGKHTYGFAYGRFGRGNNAPGMAVDWKNQVYVNCGFNHCHVRAYDADGKLIEYERKARYDDNGKQPGGPAIIGYVLDQGGSLRLDPAGNIYVLEIGLPKGVTPPKGFEKDPAYNRCNGSIYKFTPAGGEFKHNKDGSWDAEGSVAVYSAPCGPISGSWQSTQSVCHCMRPRFDVDSFGRLYIPNGLLFNVTVLDNADNRILRFGAYGNYDAEGPQSREPKPEIPLGSPIFAGATDKHIYVGDALNHRVVRVDKIFAAEQSCAVE